MLDLENGEEFFSDREARVKAGEKWREKGVVGDTDGTEKAHWPFKTHAGDGEWTCLTERQSLSKM